MYEQPCTLPVEYMGRPAAPVYGFMLPFGSYFVDMKFTDECGQVEMERVYFDLMEHRSDSGIAIQMVIMPVTDISS